MSLKLFNLRDWYVVALLGMLAALLGAWGFSQCHQGIVSIIAETLGLILPHGHPEQCQAGQLQIALAQILLLLSIIVAGAKLYVVNLRRDYRVANARRAKNHVIVCGLGYTGEQIVKSLRASGISVVAISKDVRDATALLCDTLSVPVLKSDASQSTVLKQAGIRNASAVIVTTGSDAENLEIGLHIVKVAELLRPTPLRIHVELRQGWLTERISNYDKPIAASTMVSLEFFNFAVNTARQLLLSKAFRRTFLMDPRPENPHILLVGLNALGIEIVRKSISSPFALPGVHPKFTIAAEDPAKAEALLAQHGPSLRELADFTFVSLKDVFGESYSVTEARDFLKQASPRAVIVALSDDETNLDKALRIRGALDGLDRHVVPIFVRLREQHKLGKRLREMEEYYPLLPDRFVPFGDLEELTAPLHLLNDGQDWMARTIHENYRKENQLDPKAAANVTWQNLPERFKISNRDAADHVHVALSFGRFYILSVDRFDHIDLDAASIENMAIATHCRWVRERQVRGWSYAPQRNDSLKHHPDMRNWEHLSEDTKEKDRVVVRAFQKLLAFTQEGILRESITDIADPDAVVRKLSIPGTMNILVVDPEIDDHWAAVASVEETGALLIRLKWRGSANLDAILKRKDLQSEFIFVDGWIF